MSRRGATLPEATAAPDPGEVQCRGVCGPCTRGSNGRGDRMRYRPMGNTDVVVSEIGFGTGDNAGLLVRAEPGDQQRAFERALELGINYWDTSPDYGDHIGLAEVNIGKLMKAFGVRPIITTKVEVMPDQL